MVESGIIVHPGNSIDECVRLARLAERSGFGNVFMSDSPIFTRDGIVALTAVAMNTVRIRVGTAVTNPYTRHPVMIASCAISIHELTGGRMILGIGAGATAPASLGMQVKGPLNRLRETILVCRKIFAGEPVDFNGESGRKGRVEPLLNRGPHRIPIFLAAGSPGTMALAGELADGVIISSFMGNHVDFVKRKLNEGAQRSGRSLSKFTIASATYISVADTSDEARSLARASCVHLVERTPPSLLDLWIGVDKYNLILEVIKKKGVRYAERYVDDEVINASAVAGNPQECVEKCAEIARNGVQLLMFNQPFGKDRFQAIKLIGEKVLPEISSV